MLSSQANLPLRLLRVDTMTLKLHSTLFSNPQQPDVVQLGPPGPTVRSAVIRSCAPSNPGCGHAAAVRLLVAASASFDLTDEEGYTPLLLRLSW